MLENSPRLKSFIGWFFVGTQILCLSLLGFQDCREKRRHESEVISLRNQITSLQGTVEMKQGLFAKVSNENERLEKLLDDSNEKEKSLKDELDRSKSEILTLNKVVLKWKKDYEGKGQGTQTEVLEQDVVRKRVDFKKDFGRLLVSGWTLTDPAEYSLKVEQLKPLELSLVVSRDPDGQWKTHITSSDENLVADVIVSAVDPGVIEREWYEKIAVHGHFGVGETLLLGAGISYDMGKVGLGPSLFIALDGSGKHYLGVSAYMRPFWKDR